MIQQNISDTTRAFWSIHKVPQFLVVKILRVLKFKCKRATSLHFKAAYCDQSSMPQLFWSSLSLSPLRPQNLTWENSLQISCCVVFFFVLSELLYFIFIILGSLVSFCNLSFSSVVPSLGHRHSLCSKTGLLRATPDQKFASVSWAARTGLVPQHLIKTTGWLSSGLWKIGLERLSPDQK